MRHNRLCLTCFLPLLLMGVAGHAQTVDIRPAWSVNLFTFIESGAALVDIDMDGLDEVVLCGREEVIALDGDGKELWRWRTPGRFMTSPEILPRAGAAPLIYAADHARNMSCVDGAGNLVWQAQLNSGSAWSHSTVGDVDGDGAVDVVQTDEGGNVWAFDALTGAVKWQTAVKGIPVTPAMGDVGVAVATGAGMLYLLRGDGSVVWEKTIGGSSPSWGTPGPVLFNAADGTPRIAAAGAEGHLLCLDEAGKVLWSRRTRGEMASTISVGDLDLDKQPEMFCITQTGVIYRFEESGRMLWEIDMQGRTLAPGTIADIDADGRMEYVVSTQSGRLFVFNDEGRFLFEHTFDNRTINVTPPFGEIDPAIPGRELVVTGGESGQVFCFSTGPAGTAASATVSGQHEMTPENMKPGEMATGDALRFAIEVSEIGKGLRAEATCMRPDGSRQSALVPVLGPRSRVVLAVGFDLVGTYDFEWHLLTSTGCVLLSQQAAVPISPFAQDQALCAQVTNELLETANNLKTILPLTHEALLDELSGLRLDSIEVFSLQSEAKYGAGSSGAPESLMEISAALVARARRAAEIVKTAKQAAQLGDGVSLVAFEDAVWDNRDVDSRVPAAVQNPLNISRRVVRGEHEPVAVNLFNLLHRELHVRCVLDTLPDGFTATLMRAQPSPTTQGELSWDALPELDESGIITIPPLSTRQVWLDVNVATAAPGAHNITLRLHAINGAGVLEPPANPRDVPPPETRVCVALEVLPFTMAPPGAMRLCAWAHLGDAEIADLLAHGANVFCGPLPDVKCDAQGLFAGADYSALDNLVNSTNGHDVVLLLQGMPEFPDPQETNAKRYYDDLAAHLAAQGVDEQHFALYPIDEPSIHGWGGVNKFIEFCTKVRAARPTIRLYMDGGGELPMYEAMAPVCDIWCVGINQLMENTPEMEFLRGAGGTLWSYNCSYSHSSAIRSSLKNTNIFAEYRTAALYALRWNATGIGFWCYNIGAEPWSRTELDFPLVYPGRTKPITSRRWEAVRESMEDARIAAALKDHMDNTTDENLKSSIANLLNQALSNMLDQSWSQMRLGLNRQAIDNGGNDQVLNEFRKQMLDCVETAGNSSPNQKQE